MTNLAGVLSTGAMGVAAVPARAASAETEIIRAAQAGDPEAFERLVRTYDESVLRIALNILRSPEDARDVYQEAFLRVYRNLNSFRFDCSFYTWLYRIVTNICLDHLRKRKVRKEESPLLETAEGPINRLDSAEESGPHADPERSAYNIQIGGRISAALANLTPRERVVFELRHFQGLRLKGIGEVLGTSEEAAKNCLFRATQKMRSVLGDLA